jgi:hypothetical protein
MSPLIGKGEPYDAPKLICWGTHYPICMELWE